MRHIISNYTLTSKVTPSEKSMTETGKNSKKLSECIIEEQLKKLTKLRHETMNKVTCLETKITNKHSELLLNISAVNKNAKEVPQLAKNIEIVISELRHENQALKEKIQSDIKEDAEAVVKKCR